MNPFPFLLTLIATPLLIQAATPGAWEPFETQDNANAWSLYDYADDLTYPTTWIQDPADSSIGDVHAADPTDATLFNQGLWFFADAAAGSGALVGDYDAAKITGFEVDVFVEDPAALDFVDFCILSDVGGTQRFYYSNDFTSATLDTAGWFTLPLPFSGDWFWFDTTNNQWVQATLTPTILSNITEVGVRFFPTATNTTQTLASIDNLILVPTLDTPNPTCATTTTDFTLTLTPEDGNLYTIEKLNPTTEAWDPVTGQDNITGPTPHTFTTPLQSTPEIFHFTSTLNYTPIVTPPAAP